MLWQKCHEDNICSAPRLINKRTEFFPLLKKRTEISWRFRVCIPIINQNFGDTRDLIQILSLRLRKNFNSRLKQDTRRFRDLKGRKFYGEGVKKQEKNWILLTSAWSLVNRESLGKISFLPEQVSTGELCA